MELDQLFQDVTLPRKQNRCIHPFGLDVLTDVFHMQEASAAKLSSVRCNCISIFLSSVVEFCRGPGG